MIQTYKKSILTIMLTSIAMMFALIPLSYASDKIVDILPPVTSAINEEGQDDKPTHPILRMTPDKSELIHLDQAASSIIVGNPVHINIMADSSKTLVIVPRSAGATYFTIIGKNGKIIMQRHVIVASPAKDYIRIKRVCADDAKNCQNTSVFYCPNMCHEIGSPEETKASSQNSTSKSGDGNSTPSNLPEETE